MNSPYMEDSFARLNYHVESEVGVNEQIKWATSPLRLAAGSVAHALDYKEHF